jgi:hypothetical protein
LAGEGIQNLHNRAMALTGLFLEGVNNIKDIEPVGAKGLTAERPLSP